MCTFVLNEVAAQWQTIDNLKSSNAYLQEVLSIETGQRVDLQKRMMTGMQAMGIQVTSCRTYVQAHVGTVKAAMQRKDTQISELQAQIRELQTQMQGVQAQLSELQEAQIIELQTQMQGVQAQISELQTQMQGVKGAQMVIHPNSNVNVVVCSRLYNVDVCRLSYFESLHFMIMT
jgi:chromosome segregation ATPase